VAKSRLRRRQNRKANRRTDPVGGAELFVCVELREENPSLKYWTNEKRVTEFSFAESGRTCHLRDGENTCTSWKLVTIVNAIPQVAAYFVIEPPAFLRGRMLTPTSGEGHGFHVCGISVNGRMANKWTARPWVIATDYDSVDNACKILQFIFNKILLRFSYKLNQVCYKLIYS
jgi:hypothetical protein